MFGNLFSGMNIHNMSVNFNFNNMDMFNPNVRKEHVPMLGNGGHQQLPNPNQVYLPNYTEGNDLKVAETILLVFGKTFIDDEFQIHFSDEYDFSTKPEGENIPLNDKYIVSLYGDNPEYDGSFNGEILNRREDYPPVLTILDHETFEEKELLDQMVYHTMLIASHYKFNSFFLILEESGNMIPGDPEPTTFDANKALFRKTIYSISFK